MDHAAVDSSQDPAQAVRNRLAGVWKLISVERRLASGEVVHPYGRTPVGQAIFSASGRFAAQLMRPSRAAPRTAEDYRGLVAGYSAYYGTYEVDPASRTLCNHVTASLYPQWVGGIQERHYEFDGNRVIFTAAVEDSLLSLVWERDSV